MGDLERAPLAHEPPCPVELGDAGVDVAIGHQHALIRFSTKEGDISGATEMGRILRRLAARPDHQLLHTIGAKAEHLL
ncbi:MAG: hypothetical protein HC774_06050 [Sphingomonadales bacterium]|nr:hypothetical protein [Sphingomonadales bacterium]